MINSEHGFFGGGDKASIILQQEGLQNLLQRWRLPTGKVADFRDPERQHYQFRLLSPKI